MIEFILSVVAVYFIFHLLDSILHKRPKANDIREGDFIQKINEQFYVVRDVTPEQPNNVVRLHGKRGAK